MKIPNYLKIMIFLLICSRINSGCTNYENSSKNSLDKNIENNLRNNIDTSILLRKMESKEKFFLKFWYGMSEQECVFVFKTLIDSGIINHFEEKAQSLSPISSLQKEVLIQKYLYTLNLEKKKLYCGFNPIFINDSLICLNLEITPKSSELSFGSQLLSEDEYIENNKITNKGERYMIEKSLNNRDLIISLYKKKYGKPKYFYNDNFLDSCYWNCGSNKSIVIKFTKQRENEDLIKTYDLPEYKEYISKCIIKYIPSDLYENQLKNKKYNVPTAKEINKTLDAI